MAILLETDGQALFRTTEIVEATSDHSVSWEMKLTGTPSGGGYRVAMLLVNAARDRYVVIRSLANTNDFYLEVANPAPGNLQSSIGTPFTITPGHVVTCWYVRNGDVHSFYVNGALAATVTLN